MFFLTVLILTCPLAGCGAKRNLVASSPEDRDLVSPRREHRDLIVLLPDPDGKTGVVQVTTREGSQVLDQPGYATEVADVSSPPTAPKLVSESEIRGIFGSALSAQPDLRDRFVSFLLYFDRDTTRLTPESREMVTDVAKRIQTRRSSDVFVVGHTDRVGTEGYNLDLSSKRAVHVRDLLLSSGIRPSVVTVSFYGEATPLINTEDEVAEPLNRRVEVIVR